jgi:hypothetical protein
LLREGGDLTLMRQIAAACSRNKKEATIAAGHLRKFSASQQSP